ncbi:DUF1223 domain-containing protein [Meridianimarinicoccus roseus]|uniref:DUF1223 domain-containing protein n=1 Tax=Meridianimarinicoccus roseus TaxID=2072018 RepID=A0A2V2LHY1_9RHOB|nr:DUF1223 domain-containing protein [Meridianimarinicoccus roseus]PWR03164.1 DUF1223 domain-containing protein [Meridianimarinicoccus roseus]
MQQLARAWLAGLLAGACAFTGAAAQDGGAVQAEAAPAARAPVVVELFTSQGCVSCPPADELLAELAQRDDVLPLALHVDYWDYIGWEDSFAQAAFTTRQKEYARSAGRRMIYTPQLIVGGHLEVAGYKPNKVLNAIASEKDRPARVRIDVTPAQDGALTVRLTPLRAIDGPARVIALRFRPLAEVHIERGENAGRTLHYANIVTDWTLIGTWDGTAPAEFTLQKPTGPDTLRGAVLVQEDGPGPVLSAARLD